MLVLSACGGSTGGEDGVNSVATDHVCDGPVADTPSVDDAMLLLHVGGVEPGVTYDVLQVDGIARLGGRLRIDFEDGYAPVTDQKYTVIRARCISGKFKAISTNNGVSFAVIQDSETLTLVVK